MVLVVAVAVITAAVKLAVAVAAIATVAVTVVVAIVVAIVSVPLASPVAVVVTAAHGIYLTRSLPELCKCMYASATLSRRAEPCTDRGRIAQLSS